MGSGRAEFGDERGAAPRKNRLRGTRCGGKIRCFCKSGDKGVARLVDRDAFAGLARIRSTTQERRVEQARSTCVELGDKGTFASAGIDIEEFTVPLECSGGGGEIQRGSVPGNVRVSRGIDGDAMTFVPSGPTQESRVHQGGPIGIQLSDKRVEVTMKVGLKCPWGGGEGMGLSDSGDIGVACRIQRQAQFPKI